MSFPQQGKSEFFYYIFFYSLALYYSTNTSVKIYVVSFMTSASKLTPQLSPLTGLASDLAVMIDDQLTFA